MRGKKTRYVPDMALHRDELEQLAQERFAFLTREQGFVLHSSERGAQWTSHYYLHPQASIGIQVQVDVRDDTVQVNLLRLRDGELPPHGYVDVETGKRIRVGFVSLLQDILHVEDERLDELTDMLYTVPSSERPRNHHWADEILGR